MAIKNKVDLKADADSYLPDNITEEISAGDVRQRIKDLADSMLNLIDGGLVVQALAGYSSVLTPTDNKHFATKKYVDDSMSGMTPTWGSITGTITSQTDLITYLSTNYQPLATNLTSLSGLTYASASFVKMTAAGTFSLDTNTYVTSAGLSGYALLNGSNTPFTGAIRFEPTAGVAITGRAFSTQNIFSGRDSSNVERFIVASTGRFDITGTTNYLFARFFAGANELSIQEASSRWVFQGDSRPLTFSFINNMTFSLRATNGNFLFGNDTNGSAVALNTVNSQNSIVAVNGIKIGNNTDSAATAGGGSFKYSGGLAYYSDGANWLQLATGSGGLTKGRAQSMDVANITASNALSGTAYMVKFTAPFSGDVDRIGCFVTSAASETIHLGIYSNAGSKLADGNVSAGSVVAGINSTTLSSTVTLVAGTEYWLCVKDNNSGTVNLGYQTTFTNVRICKSLFVGAGSLPANDTGFTATSNSYYIFVFKS